MTLMHREWHSSGKKGVTSWQLGVGAIPCRGFHSMICSRYSQTCHTYGGTTKPYFLRTPALCSMYETELSVPILAGPQTCAAEGIPLMFGTRHVILMLSR